MTYLLNNLPAILLWLFVLLYLAFHWNRFVFQRGVKYGREEIWNDMRHNNPELFEQYRQAKLRNTTCSPIAVNPKQEKPFGFASH